jgi:hypothetical protein
MIFGPALGLGTEVRGARLNGRAVRPQVEKSPLAQAVQPSVEFNLTGQDTVEIDFEPTVELLTPSNESKTGDSNKGLRIIKMERIGKALRVTMEGLAGQAYVLEVTQSKRIESVKGAQRSDEHLLIQFPQGPVGEFVRQEMIINLR